VKIERMTSAHIAPIGMMITYLISELVEGVEKRIVGITSLYSFLDSEYNVIISASTDFITIRQVSPEEVEKLQVPRTTTVLVVQRITYSSGKHIAIAILLAVAQRYEYCVPTKGRAPKTSGSRPITI
jgi:DNA-binding GntR family transcriptional regulator